MPAALLNPQSEDGHARPPAAGAAEITSAIIRLERTITARLTALLGKECSLDCWQALQLLSDGRGHAMSELIAHTLLPPSTVTRLVDGLIANALAYRHVDDRDRRRVLVYATHQGQELHARLTARITERRAELLRSDETLDALAAVISALER